MREFLTLLLTSVSFMPKLTTQLLSCCYAYGVIFTIHHAWTSRRALDKRRKYVKRMTSDVTHLWACEACDKNYFRNGIATQRKLTNKQKKKNANSQKNLAFFLAGTDSENKVILNTTQKRPKNGQNFRH